ncbi:hypothetical protein I4U23_024137 [Adineta vaga]|nr:hypothetical protein I4U23_024137 [Adineta vaga]
MDRIIGELFGRALVEVIGLGINAAVQSYTSNTITSSVQSKTKQLDAPSSICIAHRRAIVTASSTISFGNDCERLVNIAYQTSQTFPTMMSSYADVSDYLRKELAKQYPEEYFHIIIGENEMFGYSVKINILLKFNRINIDY